MLPIIKKINLSLVLLSVSIGYAQTPRTWEELQSEFTILTDEYLKINPEASGVIAAVDFPSHGVWSYSPGHIGQEKEKVISGDEPFIAASITKTFLATCILQLEEEGWLSIDDNVTQYIEPSIIKALTLYKGKSYEDKLTIKHLLQPYQWNF